MKSARRTSTLGFLGRFVPRSGTAHFGRWAVAGAAAVSSLDPLTEVGKTGDVSAFAREESTVIAESLLTAIPGLRVFYGSRWMEVMPKSRAGQWALNLNFGGPGLLWNAFEAWCP